MAGCEPRDHRINLIPERTGQSPQLRIIGIGEDDSLEVLAQPCEFVDFLPMVLLLADLTIRGYVVGVPVEDQGDVGRDDEANLVRVQALLRDWSVVSEET